MAHHRLTLANLNCILDWQNLKNIYIHIYNISFQCQPRLAQNLRAAIPSSSKLITYLILALVIQKKVKTQAPESNRNKA